MPQVLRPRPLEPPQGVALSQGTRPQEERKEVKHP
jgi:hypothetical protein